MGNTAIEEAAKNEGGTAGAGMGMGMGFVLAQQMGGMMNPQMAQNNTIPQASVPPSMPTQVLYHYAVNGTQMGPVPFEKLKELFANRTINKDSLVWKQGMTNWSALQDIEELKAFLGGNTPPPLPI